MRFFLGREVESFLGLQVTLRSGQLKAQMLDFLR